MQLIRIRGHRRCHACCSERNRTFRALQTVGSKRTDYGDALVPVGATNKGRCGQCNHACATEARVPSTSVDVTVRLDYGNSRKELTAPLPLRRILRYTCIKGVFMRAMTFL